MRKSKLFWFVATALVVAACILFMIGRRASFFGPGDVHAQDEKARPNISKSAFVEVMPRHQCKTQGNLFKFPMEIWANCSTHRDGAVTFAIRFKVGDFNDGYSLEAVREFVALAKQVEQKRKTLKPQQPADTALVNWDCRTEEGVDLSIRCDINDGIWVYRDWEAPELVATLEAVLLDVEQIKKRPATPPW